MCRPPRHHTSGGVLAPVLLTGVVLAGVAAAPAILAALSTLLSGLLICAGIAAGLTMLLIAGLLIRDRRTARTSSVHNGHTPPVDDSWQIYQEQTVCIQHTIITVAHRDARATLPAHPAASNGHAAPGKQTRPSLTANIGRPVNIIMPAQLGDPVDNRRAHAMPAVSPWDPWSF